MLRVNNLSFSYGESKNALENLSLEGAQGDLLLVVGQNGAGKSTFLKLLNGILKPTVGSITINTLNTRDTSPTVLAKEVAITFQHPRDQIFASTIESEVAFSPRTLKRKHTDTLVDQSLELFGFTTERSSHPYDLPPSRQKLLTAACAVASGSPIMAFDEPSAGLSIPERRVLLNAFQRIRADKLLILVSHDLDVFLPLASRVLVFHQGKLIGDESPEHFRENSRLLRKASLRLPLSIRLQRLLRRAQHH